MDSQALTVALSGIVSVFAVLAVLQLSVQATSWIINSPALKRQKEKSTN